MFKTDRAADSRIWCEITIVAVAAFLLAGGCDWFDSPSAINLPPGTAIDNCASLGEIHTGDPVTLRWTGVDDDGQIVNYEWTLDDTIVGETTETSMTFQGLPEGDHTFTVAAIDDDGEMASPAGCFRAATADRLFMVMDSCQKPSRVKMCVGM